MRQISRIFGIFAIIFTFAGAGLTEARLVAELNVDTLPLEVTTTIARVTLDEDAINVYANNDVRVLRLDASLRNRLTELFDARRNGYEVALTLVRDEDAETFTIVDFRIVSYENKLTTGFQPDRSFAPIVANSVSEVRRLFNSVYAYDSDRYDASDNCFNRAHFWSREHQYQQSLNPRTRGRGTDKVFIFFTRAYTQKYKHKWWYHVAPMIYARDRRDNTRGYVLDSTFLNSAVTLEQWLGAFDQHTDGQCERIETLDEYYDNNHRPVCLYITAAMFNYSPSDLGRRKLTNWRCSDFQNMMRSIPAPGSATRHPNAQWSDPEFEHILPQMCR